MFRTFPLRLVILMVVVCGVLGVSAVTAQDALDQQPLLKMLARIPNTSLSRTEIYFSDRKAIEVAYPPAKMPKDWAEFNALKGNDDKKAALLPIDMWWRVWRNQSSAFSSQYMLLGDKMPDVIGLDYFQIEQEMTYGIAPGITLQLAGRFDLDAVRTAFTKRGYTLQNGKSAELWCPEAGCDSGTVINIRDRNPANLFGGELGRSQPLLIEDNALISSASEVAISNHIDVVVDHVASLADLPQYQAVVEALSSDGSILQANFLDGELLAEMSVFSPASVTLLLGKQATPELIKRFLQDMLKDYETLPVYELLAFADVVTNTNQVGKVALVYSSESDAKTATAVLAKRLDHYISLATKRSLKDIFTDLRVEKPEFVIVNSNGKYVVTVSLVTLKATVDQIQQFNAGSDQQSEVTAPGFIYRLLFNGVIRRDMGWLSTVPRESIEALAK